MKKLTKILLVFLASFLFATSTLTVHIRAEENEEETVEVTEETSEIEEGLPEETFPLEEEVSEREIGPAAEVHEEEIAPVEEEIQVDTETPEAIKEPVTQNANPLEGRSDEVDYSIEKKDLLVEDETAKKIVELKEKGVNSETVQEKDSSNASSLIMNNDQRSTEGTAYAVFTNNKELILFRSEDSYEAESTGTFTDINGNTYEGKIFTDFENKTISNGPWHSISSMVLSVKIADGQAICPTSTNHWFYDFGNATSIDLHGLDTGNTTNMFGMFLYCHGIASLDLSFLDTKNVKDMSWMFCDCDSLVTLDISGFDTSNVGNMAGMFSYCSALTSLDLSHFNTSLVEQMNSMFKDCSSLTSLDLSSFDTGWVDCYGYPGSDSKGSMKEMFAGCSSLTYLDISSFNTKYVGNMQGMFKDCSSLTSIDVSHFVTDYVGTMKEMFYRCSSLTSLDISHFNTKEVTNMDSMFQGCSSLINLNVSNLNTASVSYMNHIFSGCSSLTSLDLSNFYVGAKQISGMFSGCSSLVSLQLPVFATSSTNYMDSLFSGCSSLTALDLSSLSTENVKSIRYMFYGCSGLKHLDISSFKTSDDTEMFRMFYGLDNLSKITLGAGFTTWKDSTEFPTGTWCHGSIIKSDSELISEYPSHANEWAGTWIKQSSRVAPKGLRYIPKGSYGLYIVDMNGNPLNGATVRWDSEEKTTDAIGVVIFDSSTQNPLITVSLDGYLTWENSSSNWKRDDLQYSVITLYPESFPRLALRESTFAYTPDFSAGSVDLLTKTKKLYLKNENGLVINPETLFYLKCIAIDTTNVKRYELWQKDTFIMASADGRFPEVSIDYGFAEGAGVFVRTVDNNGDYIDTYINLEFARDTISKDTSFSMDETKLSIQVADNVPFVGGGTLEFEFPLQMPIKYKIIGDKVQIGININLDCEDKYKDNGERYTEEEYLEKQLSDTKQMMSNIQTIKDYNLFSKNKRQQKAFKDLVKKQDKDFTFFRDISVDFIAYGEADIGCTEVKLCGILVMSVTLANWTHHFIVGVVPIHISFKADFKANFIGEISYDFDQKYFYGGLEFDPTFSLTALGGVGVSKIAGVDVYGKGSLGTKVALWNSKNEVFKPLSVTLTGEMGIKAYLGWIKYEKPFAHATYDLYKANTINSLGSMIKDQSVKLNGDEIGTEIGEDINDASNWEKQDLSYIVNESDWLGTINGAEKDGMYNADDIYTSSNNVPSKSDESDAELHEYTKLLSNTYRNAQPVMVSDGTNLFAAFIRVDAETEERYLSITKYDGNVWSQPLRVDDHAILDSNPCLCVSDDGILYLAYNRTSEDYNDSLLTFANSQEMVLGFVDKKNLSFTELASFANEGEYAYKPALANIDGRIILSWLSSAVTNDDDVLYPSEADIWYVTINNGSLSDPKKIKSVSGHVDSVIPGKNNDELCVAFISDQTLNSVSLLNQSSSVIAEGITGSVSYGLLPGTDRRSFFWNTEYGLVTSEGDAAPVEGMTNEYTVVDNGIYYSKYKEGQSVFAMVSYDDSIDSYSLPIEYTNEEGYLQNMSIAKANNNVYLLGINAQATITEDGIEDVKDLVSFRTNEIHDLSLDYIDYISETIVQGEMVPLTVYVSNRGDHAVSNVNVFVNEQLYQINDVIIEPGETKGLQLNNALVCPDVLTTYPFTVTEADVNDYNLIDNSLDLQIGYADVETSLAYQQIGMQRHLIISIKNNGVETASGDAIIYDASGMENGRTHFDDLKSGDTAVITYEIKEGFEAYYGGDVKVEVVLDQDESNTLDNSSVYHISQNDGVVANYTVTWVDYDGAILETDYLVQEGDTPVYNGEIPERIADNTYAYAFEGWEPALTAVTKDAIYSAKYTEIYIDYTVEWVSEGSTLLSEAYHYGEIPAYTGDTPVKESDDQYDYVFVGWSPELTSVTEDAVYTAVFEAKEKEQDVPVSSISLDESEITLNIGDTKQLTVLFDPENATDKALTWFSSKPAVARVDQNGLVTAVAEGEATITVFSTNNTEILATCTVTVKDTQMVFKEFEWTLEPYNYSARAVYVESEDETQLSYVNAAINSVEYEANCENDAYAEITATVSAENSLDSNEHFETVTYVHEGTGGHQYYVNSWHWAIDYSSAYADLSCSVCGHQETMDAVVTSQVYDNTTEFTATVTAPNGQVLTALRSVMTSNIPAVLPIELDVQETVTIEQPDAHVYYRFVPEETAFYALSSYSDQDPAVELYGKEGIDYTLTSDDDSGTNMNFSLVYKMTAGETYYFGVRYLSDVTGSFDILLKKVANISSVTVDPLILYEDNAYDTTDYIYDEETGEQVPVTYKRYDASPKSLTITFEDGNTFSGTFSDISEAVLQQYGYALNYSIMADSQSPTNVWTAGGEYTNTIMILGVEYEYQIRILESPIRSVSIPDMSIYEGTGYWNTKTVDGSEISYMRYNYNPETITIVMSDEEKSFSDASDAVNYLRDKYGEDIGYSYHDTQYEEAWTPDNTYEVDLTIGGCKAVYHVALLPSPISSVTVDNMTVLEKTHGGINSYYEEGSMYEYFRYYLEPENVTVITESGTYTGSGSYVYQKLYEDYGCRFTVQYFGDDQSYDNVWEAGTTHELIYSIGTAQDTYTYTIEKTPILSVSAEPVSVFEGDYNSYDYVDIDGIETRIDMYNIYDYTITVTTADKTYSGTVSQVQDQIRNDLGIECEYYNNMWNRQIEDRGWGLGSHSAAFTFGGVSCELTVNVIDNPITAVYVPDMKKVLGDSETRTDAQGNPFDYYEVYPSTITIYLGEESRTGNPYNLAQELAEERGVRQPSYSSEHDQYENPWTELEKDYPVEFTFAGKTCTYNVRIVENPIDHIYVPDVTKTKGDTQTMYIWIDGTQVSYEGYSVYPNEMSVHMKDGEVITGQPYTVRTNLQERYGILIDSYGTSDDQYKNPWTEAGDYQVTFYFGKFTTTYTVHIVESPIKSITVENREVYDGEQAQIYDASGQYTGFSFNDNNVTVELSDGRVFSGFEYDVLEQLRNAIDGFNAYFRYTSDQSADNPWTPREEPYPVTASLAGVETTFYITVKENPFVSVTADDFSILKGQKGEYGYDNLGEYTIYSTYPQHMTVTDKDGEVFEGEYWSVFNRLSQKYDHFFHGNVTHDQSRENEWDLGPHPVTMNYIGFTLDYTVTIVENPVASIYIPDMQLYEYNWSKITRANTGEYYYRFNSYPTYIEVTMIDGKVFNGQPYQVSQQINSAYGITGSFSYTDSQYFDNQWTAENTYTETFSGYGITQEYHITILPSPVKSITAENVKVLLGNTYTASKDGVQYERYDVYPNIIKITMTDGSFLEGTLDDVMLQFEQKYARFGYSVEDDQSPENEWEAGEQQATFTFGGASCTFNVIVVDERFEALSATDYSVFKEGGVDTFYRDEDNVRHPYRYYELSNTDITVTVQGKTYTGYYYDVMQQILEDLNIRVNFVFIEEESQRTVGWDLGPHKVTVKVASVSADYYVTVIESPYESITGKNISVGGDQYTVVEDTVGGEPVSWKKYDYISDTFTLTKKDTSFTGTADEVVAWVKEDCGAIVHLNVRDIQSYGLQWEGNSTYEVPFSLDEGFSYSLSGTYQVSVGHTYKFLRFEWSEDYSSVQAVFENLYDNTDILYKNMAVTSESTEATCEEDGVTVYTATLHFEGNDYKDMKTAVTQEKLGHVWSEPVWTWNEDYSEASAAFTCTVCGEEKTVEAVIESMRTEPTCTEAGKVVYTATVTFNDQTYTDSGEVVLEALGHEYGEPVWSWTEDHSSATATFSCTRCDHTETVTAENITSSRTEPGCETDGAIVYTAKVTFEGKEYVGTDSAAIPAIGHDWNEPTWEWADDYLSATAVFTCKNDPSHFLRKTASVDAEIEEPSCEEPGHGFYKATVTFNGNTYSDTKEVELPATGHDWNEPEWIWTEDYSSASAKFVCKHNPSHTETVNAAVTSVSTDPTCESDGATEYTATAAFNAKTYTDTKTVVIPALGHSWKYNGFRWVGDDEVGYSAAYASYVCEHDSEHTAEVEAELKSKYEGICGQPGRTTYSAEVSAENSLDGKLHKVTKQVESEILNHEWEFKGFAWEEKADGGYTVTANYVCKRDDSHKTDVNVPVSVETTPATCEVEGKIIYTATLSAADAPDRIERSESRETVIPAAGHTYGTPSWTWNDDHTKATAAFTCTVCGDKVTLDATVTSETTEPTCEKTGKTVYTATVTFEGKEYTDTKTVILKALGHNWSDPVWSWADNYSTASATFTCKNDPNHVETLAAQVTDSETDIKITYSATVTFEGKEYTDTKVVEKTPETNKVLRIAGSNRYETSLRAAEYLRELLIKDEKIEDKFNAVILTNGTGFADALAGSYLAGKFNAPILLIRDKAADIKNVTDYINTHLDENGIVYVLGGEASVSDQMLQGLERKYKRVAGNNRYQTNVAILDTGEFSGGDILVCAGRVYKTDVEGNFVLDENGKRIDTLNAYADSLSASATGLPILLVDQATGFHKDQIKFLEEHKGKMNFIIIGGTAAVPQKFVDQLNEYGNVKSRLAGTNRYDTSRLLAETFFPKAEKAVLAYGGGFADGLSGGSVAYALHSPLLLVRNRQRDIDFIHSYTSPRNIHNGVVFGGSGKELANDEVTAYVFGIEESEIRIYEP